jgi:cytochrome P450
VASGSAIRGYRRETGGLPPGNRGFPLIGESVQFVRSPREFVVSRAGRYGPVFRSHIFGRPTIVMAGPEALRFALLTHQDHFVTGRGWPRGLRLLMDGALMMKDEAEHRRTRRALSPAFSKQAVERYLPTVWATAESYFARWSALESISLYDSSKLLMFDVASQLLLGRAPGSEVSRLASLFEDYVRGMTGVQPLLAFPAPWLPFGRAMRARELLLEEIGKTIERRRRTMAKDAVSLLLEAQAGDRDLLTDEALRGHILFLLFAGHESSTSLLTNACIELAGRPEILDRARAEVTAAMPAGTAPTMATIDGLGFLNQILLETERLYPPFAGAFRQVARPFEFRGYRVPEGWQVFYCIVGTHHLPEVHDDPLRFDPDRFHWPRDKQARQECALAGFGGGAHSCLGKELARLEVKAMLALLLRDYEIEILAPQPIAMDHFPSLHPRAPVTSRLRRRIVDGAGPTEAEARPCATPIPSEQ